LRSCEYTSVVPFEISTARKSKAEIIKSPVNSIQQILEYSTQGGGRELLHIKCYPK